MRYLFTIILFFVFSFAYSQNTTYFNKLIFPYQNSVNNVGSIVQIDSISFLLLGNVKPSSDTLQFFSLIKVTQSGNIIQKKGYGDTINTFYHYAGNSLLFASDSNLVIIGMVRDSLLITRGFLIKVDPQTLDTLWTRTYTHPDTAAAVQAGASIFNAFTAIRQTYDGGFIITGMYNPGCVQNANHSAYLLKVDSVGNTQWIQKYLDITYLYDIELSPDSGYYLPTVYQNTLKAIKTDKIGNIEWSISTNTVHDGGAPMEISVSDSNYIYFALKTWYDLPYDKLRLTLCKIDVTNQSMVWEKNYIPFNNFSDQSLHQSMGLDILPSGDIIISGTSNMINPNNSQEIEHKGVIMKVNANGDSLWARWHGHGFFKDDCQFNDIALTDDGGFLAVGWQWHNNGGLFYQNAWLVKMDSLGCDTPGCHIYDDIAKVQIRPKVNLKLYPNPASDLITIEFKKEVQKELSIEIYDILGKEVKHIELPKGIKSHKLSLKGLPSGVYFYQLISANGVLDSGKFVVE